MNTNNTTTLSNNTTTLSLVENKANRIFIDASKHTRFIKRAKSMSCLMTLLSLCLIMLSGCGPNQKELDKIVRSQYETPSARIAAIKKLTDKDTVGDIANYERDNDVRRAAQERLRAL